MNFLVKVEKWSRRSYDDVTGQVKVEMFHKSGLMTLALKILMLDLKKSNVRESWSKTPQKRHFSEYLSSYVNKPYNFITTIASKIRLTRVILESFRECSHRWHRAGQPESAGPAVERMRAFMAALQNDPCQPYFGSNSTC